MYIYTYIYIYHHISYIIYHTHTYIYIYMLCIENNHINTTLIVTKHVTNCDCISSRIIHAMCLSILCNHNGMWKTCESSQACATCSHCHGSTKLTEVLNHGTYLKLAYAFHRTIPNRTLVSFMRANSLEHSNIFEQSATRGLHMPPSTSLKDAVSGSVTFIPDFSSLWFLCEVCKPEQARPQHEMARTYVSCVAQRFQRFQSLFDCHSIAMSRGTGVQKS